MGYSYGFDHQNLEVNIRAYKGHISLAGFYHRFTNKPAHYELSYLCPRGLSGAPLFVDSNNNFYIVGITIGNEITDMVVSGFREEDQNTNKITIYERTQSLHRGIAMQTQSFLSTHSRIVTGTFKKYLRKNNLLITL